MKQESKVLEGSEVGVCPFCGSDDIESTDEYPNVTLTAEAGGVFLSAEVPMQCNKCGRTYHLFIDDQRVTESAVCEPSGGE